MGGEANNTITVSQPDSLETGIDDPHNIYSFSYLANKRSHAQYRHPDVTLVKQTSLNAFHQRKRAPNNLPRK